MSQQTEGADQLLVSAYLDDALEPPERAQAEHRLEREPDLRAKLDQVRALRAVLRDKAPRAAVSEAFRDRIARIGDRPMQTPARRPTRGPAQEPPADRRRWVRLAATALISCGLGAAGMRLATQPSPQSPMTLSSRAASEALIAVHTRILLAGDPVEIASSDRHTVKPWFNAKLALSPPVADLAGDGFPLLGGRIDSVAGQRVTVLIYRRRAHFISVIAQPRAAGRDDGAVPARTTRNGYAVLTWRGVDFEFSAISDVTPVDLDGFVEKLRRAMTAG